VHLLRRADGRSVAEFDGAVWTHDVEVQDRALATLADGPLELDLYVAAAYYHEVARLHRLAPVDVVVAPLDGRESLICSLDRRFPTVTGLLPETQRSRSERRTCADRRARR
jgi:hypothetical protein